MRLLCLRNGEFYIITVVDCVKTKVGLKKNLTIHPISFGKVRLTTNYRLVSGHITHTNGTTYVGYYRDGLREGQGTWTLYDEINFVGIWKDNRRWKGKSFDEEGKEIGEYVNGEEEIYFKPSF